jgi:hypothetical protein
MSTDTKGESAAVVEVERYGEEARLREPIGLVAAILGHASGVVNDDDARYGAGGKGSRPVRQHLATLHGDEHVGRRVSLLPAAVLPAAY